MNSTLGSVVPLAMFPSGSGPGGSGWRHVDRDKHWVQLLFDSGSSLPGVAFFLVDPGPGAAVGGMQIEINTGYSCYLTAARRCQGCFFLWWIWAQGQRLAACG